MIDGQMENKIDDERWRTFAGYVFLVGVKMDVSSQKIAEYIFESFHNCSLEELPQTVKDVEEDINLYLENGE